MYFLYLLNGFNQVQSTMLSGQQSKISVASSSDVEVVRSIHYNYI